MSGIDLVTRDLLGRIKVFALLGKVLMLDKLAVGYQLAVSVGVRAVGRTACFPEIF